MFVKDFKHIMIQSRVCGDEWQPFRRIRSLIFKVSLRLTLLDLLAALSNSGSLFPLFLNLETACPMCFFKMVILATVSTHPNNFPKWNAMFGTWGIGTIVM